MTGPREPSSDLRQASAKLHEMYVALVGAGFSEAQAMTMLRGMLEALIGKTA